jgi:hypothetical protein
MANAPWILAHYLEVFMSDSSDRNAEEVATRILVLDLQDPIFAQNLRVLVDKALKICGNGGLDPTTWQNVVWPELKHISHSVFAGKPVTPEDEQSFRKLFDRILKQGAFW